VHDAFANILLGQSKGETTTGRFTQVYPIFAVDFGLTLEGVLVVLGLLEQNPNALFTVLLDEPFRNFPLTLVELVNRKQAFFAEQLDAGIQKRGSLKRRLRILAQPGVYVEQAFS
jgi:hypothetical protein